MADLGKGYKKEYLSLFDARAQVCRICKQKFNKRNVNSAKFSLYYQYKKMEGYLMYFHHEEQLKPLKEILLTEISRNEYFLFMCYDKLKKVAMKMKIFPLLRELKRQRGVK